MSEYIDLIITMSYNESSRDAGGGGPERARSTSWLIPQGPAKRIERQYHHVVDRIAVHRRNTAATTTSTLSYEHSTDGLFYAKCFIGGALSSSVRWVLTPLDLIKVSMQAHPDKYPNFVSGLTSVYRHEGGIRGLYRGLTPTILAYSTQSSVKYGLYEYWKDTIQTHLGPDLSTEYRTAIYIVSAGSAEAIADVLMCPWEMLKVKIQTTTSTTTTTLLQQQHLLLRRHHHDSVTTTTASKFPSKFQPALKYMIQYRREMNFPFGSLTPLWSRQIIGTVVNFVTFEHTVNAIYSYLLQPPTTYHNQHHPVDDMRTTITTDGQNNNNNKCSKDDFPIMTQLAVTFMAGYVSGSLSTVISHPADSLLSLKGKYPHMSYRQIVDHVGGWTTLATRGLIPRVGLTGTIIASQWLIYDTFKSVLGMGTSGGGTGIGLPEE